VWPFMRLGFTQLMMPLVNTLKYAQGRLAHHHHYRQSLVAFSFLLDVLPIVENAYGRRGLIQYQSFVPRAAAAETFRSILDLTPRRGLASYLGVTKRHRPDQFLFSHAVDGYSMALDFPVPRQVDRLEQMTRDLDQMVLEAGGRFYLAKDSTLTPYAAARYLGPATLARFRALKARCDPQDMLQTELYRRVLAPAMTMAATGELLTPQTQEQRLTTLPTGFPGLSYGLGIFDANGWIGHNGSIPGYETVTVYLPSQKATLVIMINTDTTVGGQEPSTLLARAVTAVATPDNVYDGSVTGR